MKNIHLVELNALVFTNSAKKNLKQSEYKRTEKKRIFKMFLIIKIMPSG